MPQLLILLLFPPFGLTIESIKEFGGASEFVDPICDMTCRLDASYYLPNASQGI
jgi:hypothetical protein